MMRKYTINLYKKKIVKIYLNSSCIILVGIEESSRSIGPWVMPEDTREPEDGRTMR